MDVSPRSTVSVLRPPHVGFLSPMPILLASILFISIASSAYLTNNHAVESAKTSRAKIFGRLVCSKTGNHARGFDSLGLGGTNVSLSCQKGTIPMMATARTNVSGIFVFEFELGKLNVVDPSYFLLCEARVKLPVHGCDLLPTFGTLRSTVGPDYNLQSSRAGRTTATFNVEEFEHSVQWREKRKFSFSFSSLFHELTME